MFWLEDCVCNFIKDTKDYVQYCIYFWGEPLGHEASTINVFVDKRKGRTEGLIYFYAPAGQEGAKLATAEEAVYLEQKMKIVL